MMKIIILGASGQLGKELSLELRENYDIYSFSKRDLDITDLKKCFETIKSVKPNIIINCAAYTSVDDAENNNILAYKVNFEAVKSLVKICSNMRILLIHFSSDYVFDGFLKRDYTEMDLPNPLNIYGKSKLAGENEILLKSNQFIIIRTSWVIGKYGNNFAKKIINSLNQKKEIKVITDCFGSPTSTKLILKVIKKIINDKFNNSQWDSGIYHLSSKGYTSWFEMAQLILELMLKADFSFSKYQNMIMPVSQKQFNNIASRPSNSRLNTLKIEKKLNFDLPNWQDDFRSSVLEILNLHINE